MPTNAKSLFDELLEADQENSEASRRLLLELHPRSLEIAERGASVLNAVSEALGQESKIGDHQRGIKEWAGKNKIDSNHALELLSTASFIGDK